jgi:hypothetical protein
MTAKIINRASHIEVLPAVRVTATGNGDAVDLTDYEGDMACTLMSSAGGGTSPTLDVKIQDSADGSTSWADISGATFTQVTDGADAHETIIVKSNACKRYVRAVKTVTGTSPTFDCGLTAVGFKKSS